MYPGSSNRFFNKKIIVGAVLFLVLLAGVLLYLNRSGTITITSENGAEISVATEKGGSFKKVGTTKVTFKTRKVPADIYFMATKDGKKTVSGAHMVRGKNNPLELTMITKSAATKIADGSLSNVILEGTYGQGIVPDEYTLVSFKTDQDVPSRAEFAGLPYINKVVWYDVNNFVYRSFKGGIGSFVNGVPMYESAIGQQITGANKYAADGEYSDDGDVFEDISKVPSKPLVVMSPTNLFLSDDIGKSLRSVVSFDASQDTINSVFATDTYIYRGLGLRPADYDDDSKGSSQSIISKMYQYDYSGKKIAELSIPDSSVQAVAQKGEKTYILTPNKLVMAEGSAVTSTSLYFSYVRDLTLYGGKVILLADTGIWQISDDGKSAQLIFDFSDSGVGLARSFSTSGNSLIFGTQPDKNGVGSSKMFALQL